MEEKAVCCFTCSSSTVYCTHHFVGYSWQRKTTGRIQEQICSDVACGMGPSGLRSRTSPLEESIYREETVPMGTIFLV